MLFRSTVSPLLMDSEAGARLNGGISPEQLDNESTISLASFNPSRGFRVVRESEILRSGRCSAVAVGLENSSKSIFTDENNMLATAEFRL